jgi:cation transport ATPase
MLNLDAIVSIQNLIFITGLLHFCQVPAMLCAPAVLGWAEDLQKMRPLNARIAKIMAFALVIVVLGTGLIVMIGAAELAQGGPLATSFLAFLSVLWAYRASAQIFVYRKVMPPGPVATFSQYALSLLFTFQSGAYLFAMIVTAVNRSAA